MVAPAGIHHLAIICSDYEKSKYFYTGILGFTIVNETYRKERKSYKLDLALSDAYAIELFSFEKAPPRKSYPEACGLRHLALTYKNADEALMYFKSREVRCENMRTDELTGKKFFFIFDPDDLPIEIYEA